MPPPPPPPGGGGGGGGLYQDTKVSAVRVGGRLTDWFPSKSGPKQGCLLSQILFSILIDDLAKEIKNLSIGVEK